MSQNRRVHTHSPDDTSSPRQDEEPSKKKLKTNKLSISKKNIAKSPSLVDSSSEEETSNNVVIKEEDPVSESDTATGADRSHILKMKRKSHSVSSSDNENSDEVSRQEKHHGDGSNNRNSDASSSSDESIQDTVKSEVCSEEEIETKFSSLPHNFVDDDIYVEYSGKSCLKMDELDADDEVWLVQCPINISATSLIGKSITFGADSKLKLKSEDGSSQMLEIFSDPAPQDKITCVIKNAKRFQAVCLPLSGKITLAEHIDSTLTSENFDFASLFEPKQKVAFPEGLKVRHPLFGTNFEHKVENLKVNKKKHKKEAKIDLSQIQSKKRKREKSVTPSEVSPIKIKQEYESSQESPKRKKKKH